MAAKKKAAKKKAAKKSAKKARRRPPSRPRRDDSCFITTACVEYYGLSDDCTQLETLRQFRDSYLIKRRNGKQMLREYYFIAPRLVEQMKSDPEHEQLFQKIFQEINFACEEIQRRKFGKAKVVYENVVQYLLNRYQ